MIIGFIYDSNDRYGVATGKPVCSVGASVAATLTGQLVHENGRIPMYSDSGTMLTGSILFQTGGRIGVNTTSPTAPAILDINGDISISDGAHTDRVLRAINATGLATWGMATNPCNPAGNIAN